MFELGTTSWHAFQRTSLHEPSCDEGNEVVIGLLEYNAARPVDYWWFTALLLHYFDARLMCEFQQSTWKFRETGAAFELS